MHWLYVIHEIVNKLGKVNDGLRRMCLIYLVKTYEGPEGQVAGLLRGGTSFGPEENENSVCCCSVVQGFVCFIARPASL